MIYITNDVFSSIDDDRSLNSTVIKNPLHQMDDLINDIEEGIPYNPPRQSNKKMKKRKQLDALLKFRSSKSNRDALRSSEDELFLPDEKPTQTKHSSPYRRWCSYTRHILSFCLVCIFMIVCVGLAYANIELKHEVQNLSSRVTDIEKRFSSFEINRVILSIEQIKTRLNLIERWNTSYLYDRLQKLQSDFKIKSPTDELTMTDEDISSKLESMEQKSTQFSEVANELDKLSRDADNQVNEKTKPFDKNLIEHLLEQERRENAHQDANQLAKNILSLNESLYANTIKWNDELKSLRNDFQNLNQSIEIQELINLVQNSSDKTSSIMSTLQSDLDRLRKQIEACKCPKVSNTTINIAQILNQPSSIPN